MDPVLLSVESKDRAPSEPLRARQLLRLLRLIAPYRKWMVAGLLFTTVFAGAHTIGIAGVFPVFKVLLESEGIHGWTERILAGDRLGAELARPSPGAAAVRVIDVSAAEELALAGVQRDDMIAAPEPQCSGDQLLARVARAEFDEAVELQVHRSTSPPSTAETVAFTVIVRPKNPEWTYRLLGGLVRWLPDDHETQGTPAELARRKMNTLVALLTALVSLVAVANVFRYIGEVLVSKAVLMAMMDLRDQLYERTLQLPMAYFAHQNTADVITRFVQDIQEIQRGLRTLFGKMIREPMRIAFTLAAALVLDWRITLTMLVVGPVTLLVFLLVGRSVKKANTKLLQAYGRMIAALTTSLQNLRVVKVYTAEKQEQDRLEAIDQNVFRQQYRLARLEAFVSPMVESLAVIGASIGIVWLAGRVLSQELDISRFATLGFVLANLFDPLRKMTDVYVRVKRSSSGAERIFAVIDQPVECELFPAEMELGPLSDCIEFDRVGFIYPGATQPALQDFSLVVRKGETVAVVGPNGSGKTTLVSLLPRLYDPTSGVIRYDGVDLRRASLTSLRRQIGLVTQDAVVFEGTPAANITYGTAEVNDDRMLDAARRARAEAFVRQLDGAFQAILGERGTTLSGGQRQRLAIARAIFRDAPILIFDEATSQIDTESEQEIQIALREFCRGRTTIIIAHRLSTIHFAERVVVMDNGRLVDHGTHGELIGRCKLYRALCETQFGTGQTTAMDDRELIG